MLYKSCFFVDLMPLCVGSWTLRAVDEGKIQLARVKVAFLVGNDQSLKPSDGSFNPPATYLPRPLGGSKK